MREENMTQEDKTKRGLKAVIARDLFKKRMAVVKNLSPARKQDVYYNVYKRLDIDSIQQKLPTIIPPGIDKVIFYNVPLQLKRVGQERAYDVTIGELIRRIHLACEEEIKEELVRQIANND